MADIAAPLKRWSYASVSDKIADIVLTRPTHWLWFLAFAIASLGTIAFVGAITYLFMKGVGIWGVNIPVAWGFAIANFVWWIGIGHAGTFISAILLLLRQKWRTSINRFAEAMTLFAAGIAGLFPILHLGRPWFFYWLLPYPNVMELWPQWRSALVWDVFAIGTYLITGRHLENSAKILLACGWIVAYGYCIETFTAFYSGEAFEIALVKDRFFGFYGPVYWTVLACNVLAPQLLWWRTARRSAWVLFTISLLVNVGMWLERVMIVVQSMHHDFMPSAWGNFIPTRWDWIILAGSLALFVLLFLLFVRLLPAISIFEMRQLIREEKSA